MQSAVGAQQTLQRVDDEREEADDHAHHDAGEHLEAEPEADHRHDRKDRHGLEQDRVGIQGPLDPARLHHRDGEEEPDADRDREADERRLRRHPEGVEHVGANLGIEEAFQRTDLVDEAVGQFFATDLHFAAAEAFFVPVLPGRRLKSSLRY